MASLIFWTVDPVVTVAIITAAIGPIGAYMIAVRRLSGKIANSDAEQLWAESKAIRDWSSHRIDDYEREIKDLREALSSLSNKNSALEAENTNLLDRLSVANNRMEELIELVGRKRRSTGGKHRIEDTTQQET